MFHGALFDMDGLLLDTESLMSECFMTAAREIGRGDLGPVLHSLIGVRRQESEVILGQHIPDSAQLARFVTRSDALYTARMRDNIPVKAGAVELLEKLAAKGIPCAVATSSTTENARHHLERAGLLGFFQSVTGGDQVVHAKPAPDIYLKAAETLGVTASDCAAFEDSEPGTRAAFASGARVVQVPDMVTPTEALRALGHVIAPSLLAGATEIGLI